KITASDNSILSQPTPAGQLDVNLLSGVKGQLDSALQDIQSFVTNLQNGATALSQLTAQIPLLDQVAGGSISKIIGLVKDIQDFETAAQAKVDGIVSSTPKLSAVVAALNALVKPSEFGTITFSADYRGAQSDSSLEELINVSFSASASADIPIDL